MSEQFLICAICGSKTFLKSSCLPCRNLREGGFIRVHSWLRLPDHVLYIEMGRMIPVRPRHQSDFDRTNFLHRFLRTKILFPDKEHDALNKLKRVIEQQLFHFPVVTTAPEFSRQKRPSDFNLGFLWIITVESRRSDDVLRLCVDYDKRSAGFQRFSEKNLKYLILVSIALRMLFPDERVRRDGKKIVPVFRCERPKFDQLAF